MPLAPAQIADGAVIDGAGLLFTVTATPADCALQPLEFVTVTEYVPVALTLIDCVVAPLLQAYCDIPAGADSVTLPPVQNVVEPFGVMVVSGSALTVTVALALPLQLPLVTVTPRVIGPEADVNVMAFVPLPEVIVPFVIVQAYVAPAIAAVDAPADPPAQIAGATPIDGAGLLLTVTAVAADVALHPFASVTVTL